MKVLLTGSSYPSSTEDWKGLFMARMVEALAARPAIELRTWLPPGPLPTSVHTAWSGDDAAWLHALMERGGIAHLLRTQPLLGLIATHGLLHRLRRAYAASDAPLFHVNWLQNALSLPQDGRPTLVTALGSDLQLLKLPFMRILLRRAFRGHKVALCPNADWMVAPLQRAFGDMARVQCVPFGVDAAWFGIERKPAADGIHRWVCVSRLTAAKLGPLFEWSEPLFHDTPARELHLVGPRQEAGIAIPSWVRFHGPATPTQLQREHFPIATGLLSLSRHAEGRPQVMLESMAASLPILASRIDAHSDIVEQAKTGWLCNDPEEFTAGMAMIENLQHNTKLGQNARLAARERFGDWSDCANRYAVLYTDLLDGGV